MDSGFKQTIDIILASGSPRRKELFEKAGLNFTVMVSDDEEYTEKKSPAEYVTELAVNKGRSVVTSFLETGDKSRKLIVSADTIVVGPDGDILGKPADKAAAVRTLMELSGKVHKVYTGVAWHIVEDGVVTEKKSFYEATEVEMCPYDQETAEAYVLTGEPMDKAGAYGIQGLGMYLVKEIRGDYNPVVGFPMAEFLRKAAKENLVRL